ncbi:MAG: multidrug DMT transporter permease [Sphingobacteriales bacterium 50-39]|nr:multidrug DMT transporter permease [Sphingobacteriales bacterium]OJW53185.1 MAG: multidrug DMT transporter permease [Sphingobacteriales bacterium 50-39]
MFIVENYSVAIFFCFITMLCWGSWANTQKLAAASWRFELFYWDYVLGILLTAILFALTLGSFGAEGRGFIADIRQASGGAIGSALLGGAIFNAANILLVAAIAVAGMSVAFPVGIGIALAWGVVVNYLDNPIGNSLLLFAGVGLIIVAILLNAYAYRRASATQKKVSTRGLVLSVVAGILMGFFYKYVAASMFPDFAHPQPGKLSPYTAVFIFSAGILLSNFLFNTILMKRPVAGPAVKMADYFSGNARNHLIGVLGGAIWCIGMSFSILASGKAGPAISYGLGQGATVVAAIWGIFIWKEFKHAPKGTSAVLNGMLLCYLAGLGLLIAAR